MSNGRQNRNVRRNFNYSDNRRYTTNRFHHQQNRRVVESNTSRFINDAGGSSQTLPKRLTLQEKYLRRTEWLLKTKNELMSKMLVKQKKEMETNPNFAKNEHSALILKLDEEIILLERDRIRYLREQAENEINIVANAIYNNSSRSPSPHSSDKEKRYRSVSQNSNSIDLEHNKKRSRETNYRHSTEHRSRNKSRDTSENLQYKRSRRTHSRSPQRNPDKNQTKRQHRQENNQIETLGNDLFKSHTFNQFPESRTSTNSTSIHEVIVIQDSPKQDFFPPESNIQTMVPNLYLHNEESNNWFPIQSAVIEEIQHFTDKSTSSQYGRNLSPFANDKYEQNESSSPESKHSAELKRIGNQVFENIDEGSEFSQPWLYKWNYDQLSTPLELKKSCDSNKQEHDQEIIYNQHQRDHSTTDSISELKNTATMVINQQTAGIPTRVLDKNRVWFDEECLIVARAQHISRKLYNQNPTNLNLKDYEAKKKKMENLFRKKYKAFQRQNVTTFDQPLIATEIVLPEQKNSNFDADIDGVEIECDGLIEQIKSQSKNIQQLPQEHEMANEPWYDEECDAMYKLKCDAWDIYHIYETSSNKKNLERCQLLVDKLFQKKEQEYQQNEFSAKQQAASVEIDKDTTDDDMWYDNECQDAENAMNIALEIYENNENEDNLEVYNIRKRQCEKIFQQKRQFFVQNSSDENNQHQRDHFNFDQFDRETTNEQKNNHDLQRMITPPPPKLSQSDFDLINSDSKKQLWQISNVSNDDRPTRNIRSQRNPTDYPSHDYDKYDAVNRNLINIDNYGNTSNSNKTSKLPTYEKCVENSSNQQPKWQSSFKEIIDPNSFDIAGKLTNAAPSVNPSPQQVLSNAEENRHQQLTIKTTNTKKTNKYHSESHTIVTDKKIDQKIPHEQSTINWQQFVNKMNYKSPQFQHLEKHSNTGGNKVNSPIDDIYSKTKQLEKFNIRDNEFTNRRDGNDSKNKKNEKYSIKGGGSTNRLVGNNYQTDGNDYKNKQHERSNTKGDNYTNRRVVMNSQFGNSTSLNYGRRYAK